jgi:hypothetical protein
MKGIFVFAVLAALAGPSWAAVENPIVEDPAVQGFWKTFREAVLKNDRVRIEQMTKFPFHTRGPLDFHPELPWQQSEFRPLFDSMLGDDPTLGSNMKKVVKNHPYVLMKDLADGPNSTSMRIGEWEFEKTDKGWLFSLAYLDYDENAFIQKHLKAGKKAAFD